MSLPQPRYLRLDLFPAEVEGFPQTTRVIVTDSNFYFFTDTPQGPQATVSGVLYSFTGRNTTGYTITAEDDTTYLVRRSSGCGCGSRLRGFRPFPGVPLEANRPTA